MRKQTKIAAVVSAAALLALGASMTSFAASKGTWMMVDGEWYCYDKNGDAYTRTHSAPAMVKNTTLVRMDSLFVLHGLRTMETTTS